MCYGDQARWERLYTCRRNVRFLYIVQAALAHEKTGEWAKLFRYDGHYFCGPCPYACWQTITLIWTLLSKSPSCQTMQIIDKYARAESIRGDWPSCWKGADSLPCDTYQRKFSLQTMETPFTLTLSIELEERVPQMVSARVLLSISQSMSLPRYQVRS